MVSQQAAAKIPGYELLNTLGQGATGTVYLARQDALDRYVAIKRLAPALASDPTWLERFRAEAQLMAAIEHPNVVRVYEFVEGPEGTYLVCEFVEGASLRAVLRKSGRLAPEQCLGILQGALEGLAYAHSRGLVHRDIKPDNLLADREGNTKLTDFGEAVAGNTGAEGAVPAGTPAYMSPEVVIGGAGGSQSDIYSAAAMLFELLTGRAPYPGDSTIAVMRMQVESSVPNPCDLNHSLPPRIGAMVMRGMAKNPADRFGSVEDFLSELAAAALEGYGEDWKKRASIKVEAAAAATTAAALLASLGGVAAGASGFTALAATAVAPYVVAAGVIGVLTAGSVAGAFASGLLGSSHAGAVSAAVATATPPVGARPSPSDASSTSPSPSASPSPSPSRIAGPTPHASAAPGVAPTAHPAPVPSPPPNGRVSISNATVFYRTCTSATACFAETDGTQYNSAANPLGLICHAHITPASYLAVREQYAWTYTGQGSPVTLHLAWSGRLPDGSADPGKSWNSDVARPGPPGSHAWNAGVNEYADGSTNLQTGVGFLQYAMTWTNPDGSSGSAAPVRLYYKCA